MISLKHYLDAAVRRPGDSGTPDADDLFPLAVDAYRSALQEVGSASLNACPPLGKVLQQRMAELEERLSGEVDRETIASSEREVREHLREWGESTAGHYRQKTGEVKELLIAMARTAESVGAKDWRCATQMNQVTARLKQIATLEDLTAIRASIEQSAVELKSSIDRMAEESRTLVEGLKAEVSNYQVMLEEAEQVAWRDTLTGLRNRPWVEEQIQRRIQARLPLSVAIVDIDAFKKVNDEQGHMAGDELLKQFGVELQSACRSTDTVGRWGGDEFIVLLECGLAEAETRIDRLRNWICGNYTLQGRGGPVKLHVEASIGLAEHKPEETMKHVLERADTAMYERKARARRTPACVKA
jgi:diguanylate cyclase (GGDEF)-like protein